MSTFHLEEAPPTIPNLLFQPSTVMSHEINLTKDAKISFAKMQAGEYDEDAAQKKLEDP